MTLEPGDAVRVAPSEKGKRDGYSAYVSKVNRRAGRVVLICPDAFPKSLRVVPLERIARVHRRSSK